MLILRLLPQGLKIDVFLKKIFVLHSKKIFKKRCGFPILHFFWILVHCEQCIILLCYNTALYIVVVSFKYFMAFPAAYTTQPNKVEILLRVGSILLAFLVYYISMFYYANLLVTRGHSQTMWTVKGGGGLWKCTCLSM